MAHNLVRALILPQIIIKIQQKFNIDENIALKMFYNSNVGRLFSEEESGLYGQSPNYIFSLFENEMNEK